MVLLGCGSDDSSSIAETPTLEPVIAKNQIVPTFSPARNNQVVAQQAANATGALIQPYDNEVFTGNILVSVEVEDPDGLAMVALSFNQSDQLKYLCEPGDDCPAGVFTKTETNINPADYGVYVGLLTVGLWVLDQQNNQMLVDTVSLDWQLRRIQGASATRTSDGMSIELNWQNQNDLLKYNVLLATESGVTLDNYGQLASGQAILAVDSAPQTFSGLNASQKYFVIITGVDGSGESAFSSEFRLAPPSGLVNTPPQVNADTYSSAENQSINGNLLLNDNDLENDLLTVSPLPIDFPLNGDVEIEIDGTFTYQPRLDFSGTDRFVYEVQDGQGGVAQGMATISIDSINDPPTALPDDYATLKNVLLTIPSPGVLSNDSDIDGDTIEVNTTPIESTANGTLTLNIDGAFSYQPDQDFVGSDFFVYQISDPFGLTDQARVNIAVGDVNVPPIAVNDAYNTDEDQTLTVLASNGVLSNDFDDDGDSLQLQPNLISNVNNGTLTIDDQGAFTYVPNANFFGSDGFVYEISDGNNNTAQASVAITLNAVNDAPTALDDNYTTNQDTDLAIAAPGLLTNDSDIEQDNLTVITTAVSGPQNGNVNLAVDGAFDYTPDAGFSGQDSFTYEISDGNGGSDTAQVMLTVQALQTFIRATSLTTAGLLTLEGLGETTLGSGIGQVRYTLGDCVLNTVTVCTLTGTYQENSNSDYNPNSTGTFTMEFTYSGRGVSPVIAASTQPGGNSVSFTQLGDGQFTLIINPDSGGQMIGQFPAATAEQTMGFGAFFDTNATCTGLAIGQGCSVGQVGLTPGAIIQGNVTPFTFVVPM